MNVNKKPHKKFKDIWKQSQKYIVGGVNSPVRAFKSVGGKPIPMRSGKGCYLKDFHSHTYLDFLNSWGPLILGHSHPKVIKTLKRQIKRGTSFGTITKNELKLAKLIIENISHIDKIRFVSSGTEAVMTAIRLARAITKKNLIIKFDGCYHGHSDSMLVSAGSGLMTQNEQTTNSGGLTYSLLKETIVLPLDDEDKLKYTFQKHKKEIACVIIEPLPANSGLLPQREEFLKILEELCNQNNSLLIFDEVITGFRLGFSGFAGKYDFNPDIVTYGKIIGGGLPIGAVAGKQEWLNHLSPEGDVYQAGTLSGNPLAMSLGEATLSYLLENNVYTHLRTLGDHLEHQFQKKITPLFDYNHDNNNYLSHLNYKISLVREESVFWLNIHKAETNISIRQVNQFWSESPKIYKEIFWSLIEQDIYTAPSAYEVGFLSYPMKKKDINEYIAALGKAINKCRPLL